MIEIKSEIKFEGGRIEIDNNRIVKFTTDVGKLELNHAENFIKSLKENNVRSNVLIIFDAQSLEESTDGIVKKYTVGKLEKHASALAVLNNSSISRFLIHTFLAIYRPNIPVRMFDEEDQARRWLITFRDPEQK
ncbi:DUF7793 family protein [Parvicella tangerina]|uniref:DUF7793 family protein n=1 Tax=Parvicella tangerina TaxID=2829795 RepID=UPI00215BA55D|nr:STAS/SEC14 domain-containing protein [Parvicella tangerina]